MAFDSQKTRFANEVWQESYKEGAISNVLMRDRSGLIQKLMTGGADIEEFEQSKLVWYIDDNNRAVAGYSGATTRDYTSLAPQERDGKQLGCGYDRLYVRTERPGLELREGGVNKFIDEMAKTLDDMPRTASHALNVMLLGDGLGTIEASPSGYTASIAADATSTVENIRVNRFHQGMLLDKTDSSGAVEATNLWVQSINVREGVGEIVIKNVGSGTATITDGGDFVLSNSVSTNLGHGLDYLINDGGKAAGTANFARYLPRNAANNSYIDRFTGEYEITQKPMVIDWNSQDFGVALLDEIELRYRELADELAVEYELDGGGIGYSLPLVISPAHYMALQKEARSSHQRGFTDTVEVEDVGLKKPKYGNFVFYECKAHKADTAYIPYIPDCMFMMKPPELVTSSDWGAFKQKYGADVYEHVQSIPWQFMLSKGCNSMRIDNVKGAVRGS